MPGHRLLLPLLLLLAAAPALAWTTVGDGIEYQSFTTSHPDNLFVARMARSNPNAIGTTPATQNIRGWTSVGLAGAGDAWRGPRAAGGRRRARRRRGVVTFADASDPANCSFYLDGGSGLSDGGLHRGVRLRCGSIVPPQAGPVSVTGIVTSEVAPAGVVPVLLVTDAADIQAF